MNVESEIVTRGQADPPSDPGQRQLPSKVTHDPSNVASKFGSLCLPFPVPPSGSQEPAPTGEPPVPKPLLLLKGAGPSLGHSAGNPG